MVTWSRMRITERRSVCDRREARRRVVMWRNRRVNMMMMVVRMRMCMRSGFVLRLLRRWVERCMVVMRI